MNTTRNTGADRHALHNIPVELRALPQWVCWHREERNDKWTKPPIDAKSNGKLEYAKVNDPATWSDFDTAVAAAVRLKLAGVGLALSEFDHLTCEDLDHVLNRETGELKPEAAEVVARFQGTYIEVSPSGDGLHIWCKGQPQRSGKCEGAVKWLEVYSYPSSRYLTVTGNIWPGSVAAVTEQQAALDWLHTRFMATSKDASTERECNPSSPVDIAFDLNDEKLLDKARNARNARNGAIFEALWAGDLSGHGDDHSAADMALCDLLAWWTDRDPARMDRMFRQSGLFRAKWDERRGEQTYGQITLAKAIAG
jgi:primase-polymerase (primpol)-like protein